MNGAKLGDDGVLYQSTGVSVLRVLAVFALTFLVGSGIFAALLITKESAVGEAISSSERFGWAIALPGVFLAFFLGVWAYLRHMALCIRMLPDGQALRVTTATLFGTRDARVRLDALVVSRFHEGDRAGEAASAAPWLWVKVRHGMSFFVSLGGNIPNKQRLLTVLHASR